MKTIAEIKDGFKAEFGAVADKFVILELQADKWHSKDEDCIWHPGVYVWWHPTKGNNGPIKVGRHLTNARKRAMEHLSDDTGGRMKCLEDDPETKLLLLNVRNPDNYHWVAALEIFLEDELDPEIKSKRKG